MFYDPTMKLIEHKPETKASEPLLLLAAAFIRERGWCQEAATNDAGNVCMIMAIDLAGSANPVTYGRLVDKMANHLRDPFPHRWNDQPGRTKEEVIAALEAAAYE